MNIPANLKYTKSDEWVRVEGTAATAGLTDYAQNALSDIVYVELPPVGEAIGKGEKFGSVESVKAASDIYAPVAGEVIANNQDAIDAPESVNADAYSAWLFKLAPANAADVAALMDAAAYEAEIAQA